MNNTIIYKCPPPDGCGLWLTQGETYLAWVWYFPFLKVRKCLWCNTTAQPAQCQFRDCREIATHLDWNRVLDVEVPFCPKHYYRETK